MNKNIPLSVPNFKGNELKYVTNAIETEWVSTGGAYINKFEDEMSKYLNVTGAVACQSGTAGLHLAMLLADVKSDDEVIVPTVTFIAAINPVSYIGAHPVFMDCDDNLTMDLDKLEYFLDNDCSFENNRLINLSSKRTIKALVIVHVFGNMPDMSRLTNITKKYNLKLIEDATEALGSKFIKGENKDTYAGTIGDIGVFSFNGNKIITTGGGGMLVSNNKEILDKAKYLSTQAKDDSLYYIHHEIGYNYRMTNLQAALGVAQLEQLESFISIKRKNYYLYKNYIDKIDGIDLIDFNAQTRPNYWFYGLIIDPNRFNLSKDDLMQELNKRNIQTRPLWGLIHKQKPYENSQSVNINKAYYYHNNLLNIPCSSNLEEDDVKYISNALKELSMR